MLRHSLLCLVIVLVLVQVSLAQDVLTKEFEKAAANWKPHSGVVANKKVARPSPPTLDVAQNVQPNQWDQSNQWSQPGPAIATADAKVAKSQAAVPTACIELDILMGCVVFDEKGELRLKREDAEPEVNRAGTIGSNLAAMLNEKSETLPAGVSPGTAGANFLLEGLAGEEKLGQLEQFRLRLRADGTEATCQFGQHVPRITGSSARSGNLTNTISMENVGSMIGGSAEITKTGKIALSLQVERSDFGPEEEGTPIAVSDGETVRTPRLDTMTIKTQVAVADGESIVLNSCVRLWSGKVTETFVVVTATVVK
jgi:type II/III secretion system protein